MTVSKIATRIRSLLDITITDTSSSSSSSSSSSPTLSNDIIDISDKLIRDVSIYNLDMAKLKQIYTLCDNEITAYNDLFHDIETQIIDSQNDIIQLKEELYQQQLIRKHREECEALATDINILPNLKKLDGSIKDNNTNLNEVCDAIDAINGKIDQRSRQYDALMQAIADMQNKLNDDEDFVVDTIDDDDNADEDIDGDDSRREREIETKNDVTIECEEDDMMIQQEETQ